jgi:hypothetical protein
MIFFAMEPEHGSGRDVPEAWGTVEGCGDKITRVQVRESMAAACPAMPWKRR